jgi:hypothetical protein
VTVYYFYMLDSEFGLGFIKIRSYFPYPLKISVNGHEWAKRQAALANSTPVCLPCSVFGQSCAVETALLERVSQPYVRDQRTGALRFGDLRVMARPAPGAEAVCRRRLQQQEPACPHSRPPRQHLHLGPQ